jgi:tetratricopeptide (TPR) repeat protein
MDREAFKLKFRDEFRSHHGEAFQHWFEELALVLHGTDCFQSIRVTRGDGGLDGLVLKSGWVYQVYAPPSLATDAATADKVKRDFAKACATLGASLRRWTLIHNSPDGKIGHLTAAALAELGSNNPESTVEALGIDGLWTRLNELQDDSLADLFGSSEPSSIAKRQVRVLLKRATSYAHENDMRKAVEVMRESLAIAQADRSVELEAEVLIGLCLASSRHDGRGDRAHYILQLKPLTDQIRKPILRAMAHRAHAAYLQEQRDYPAEEIHLQAAIQILLANSSDKNAPAQLCVVRSEYAHLLCRLKRMEEAKNHVELAESYARGNPEEEAGELLDAALGAGMHWAALARDADAVIERVNVLEASTSSAYRAARVSGHLLNITNNLSREGLHSAALAAAEATLRLAHKAPREMQEDFLPGALYTVAMVHFHAGNRELAMAKAKSLLALPISSETAPIRQAAAQLVSVVARRMGDTSSAVNAAEAAVGAAADVVGHALAKLNLAESLADHGHIERALESAEDARNLIDGHPNLPARALIDVIGHIAQYAAQLGDEEKRRTAGELLEAIVLDDEECDKDRRRFLKRAEIYAVLRKRLIEASLPDAKASEDVRSTAERVGAEVQRFNLRSQQETAETEGAPPRHVTSLHEANAAVLAPVFEWWKDTRHDAQAAALDLDYWARGGFAQILRNLRAFPHNLNITLEVRSLSDIQRSIRLWGMYSDFLLLIWKGRTETGKFLHFVDSDYFGPWGAGYLVALGDQFKQKETGRSRSAAIGYASWLPAEVMSFLLSEGRPFMEAGRLLIVPASAVGCLSPGFGSMEQLVAEAACAMPATRGLQRDESPFGPLPYSPDVPSRVLFDLIEARTDELVRMRSLLSQRANYFRANGLAEPPKSLERDIADALRLMRSVQRADLGQAGAAAIEHVGLSAAPFRTSGIFAGSDQAFAPLLALESMGYAWKVSAQDSASIDARYEPSEGEAIGAWLVPPEPGMSFPMVRPSSREGES